MLASEEIIKVVANALEKYQIPCVVDPVGPNMYMSDGEVMISASGSHLIPVSAVSAYLTDLLPYTTLLTPNIPEALHLAKLVGHDFGALDSVTPEKLTQLAISLAANAQWVLLKGGHGPLTRNGRKSVVDILVNKEGRTIEFVSDFSNSKNTHGTGCTLACIPPLSARVLTEQHQLQQI